MRDLKEVEKVLLPPTIVGAVDVCWWVAGFPWLPVVISLSAVYVVIDLTIAFVALYYLIYFDKEHRERLWSSNMEGPASA